MKSERLLNAFGQIDESYILEAAPQINHLGNLKTKKIIPFLGKSAAIAASLALFICISGTAALAAAGELQGFFVDIFDWKGAVVGTSYAQATDEITLTVTHVSDNITVEMVMVYPDRFPYRGMEMLGIANYKIVDQNNKVLTEGHTEMAPVMDGKVSVHISAANVSEGGHKLIITELMGSKGAEQPLVLSGNWECEVTK